MRTIRWSRKLGLPLALDMDGGYRGHGIKDISVHIAGQKRGVTRALRRALKRRNAIEPIIGHCFIRAD